MATRDETLAVIGAEIRAARTAADITQDELGTRAGIGGKYVSEIERGTRDLPLSTLRDVVERGLGLKLDIAFRAKADRRAAVMPGFVEDLARRIAALPHERRAKVVAVIETLLEL
jgi:transcriptional regulator with XRE-family HTH domain